jgi:hypothetical protein
LMITAIDFSFIIFSHLNYCPIYLNLHNTLQADVIFMPFCRGGDWGHRIMAKPWGSSRRDLNGVFLQSLYMVVMQTFAAWLFWTRVWRALISKTLAQIIWKRDGLVLYLFTYPLQAFKHDFNIKGRILNLTQVNYGEH